MSTERYGDTLFDHVAADEQERLASLSATFDPISFCRLSALGVRPTWRCLDIGAGTGSVARWLGARVPAGAVVALDRSDRFLGDLGAGNVTVVRGDVITHELPPASFDLVHARFLLMHLRERERVLDRMVSWLAPGGWLVVGDTIDFMTGDAPRSSCHAVIAAMWRVLGATIGTDVDWGRRYPAQLRARGLTDLGVEVYLPPFVHGAPIARTWLLMLTQMRARLVELGGVAPHVIDDAVDQVCNRGLVEVSVGMVNAWGRRPATTSG